MKSAVTEQSVAEKIENGEKEKKKKRRSNRRSKHSSVGCAAEEVHGDASEGRNCSKAKNCIPSPSHTSSKQLGLESHPLNEIGVMRACNVAFNSLPLMHLNKQAETGDSRSLESQQIPSAEIYKRMITKSCPEPWACEQSPRMNGDLFQQIEGSSQRKIFSPYWSLDAVNEALEKGQAFKALFRVNAHNRNEAYCKIDGVPTDILVNGIVSQNRAVEGDIVVIKLDPFSLWPKMKGFVSENSPRPEEVHSHPEGNELAVHGPKGKGKADVDYENTQCGNGVDVVEAFEDGPFVEKEPSLAVFGQKIEDQVNIFRITTLDSSHSGSSSVQTELLSAVEKLCTIISSFPSKRPTGRVVAIAEKSLRRDTIVGFLNVKQWIHYREGDGKKNELPLSLSDDEYLQLMPTDPRFPKMIVPLRDLLRSIKTRLESPDATLETELVAAQIVDWGEGSPSPQANVVHIFGRGGQLEPQINAILYQNSVRDSDFSPDSLCCVPRLPWKVPEEEFQHRKDLRNLCAFTIDPSTATDLDDALSVEGLPGGFFRVGVHIADVSYFVLPDTALDVEAQVRSTSIYMLQRKLPMLPPLLSESLGSLNPGVDRLVFSIFWDLNGEGDVMDRWTGRTVIRSCCKLSYDHAQDIIDGMVNNDGTGNGWPELHGPFQWSDVIRSVKSLSEISNKLRQKRFRNGALQLESSKPLFLFDENGTPYDCLLCGRKGSNFLVEEFMFLANRTVAEIISRAYPDSALLRRHPAPNMRKIREFEAFCSKHGLELDVSSSARFHESLERIREKLKDDLVLVDILINYATRPMQLAAYFCSGDLKDNVADWGHYALAVPLYTHFTSPLRRYPDIVVHRMIAAALEAEELYAKLKKTPQEVRGCFTGIRFDKEAAESLEGKEALSAAAVKHGVPCTEILADVAAYCNERKLAGRNVKDACDKLCTWFLLKRKEVLLSEARVMGLGPRFMSIYINKLAIERRIYYDEVEGLSAEWLEATSTLVLDRRHFRKGGRGNFRPFKEVAHVVSPYDLCATKCGAMPICDAEASSETLSRDEAVVPAVFPLTVRLLSTIPVALHAVGGDDGPLDIGVRLYMSSYHR